MVVTEPKYNSSPQYSVKQILNLGATSNCATVTPNDSTDLPNSGLIRIGGDGDVKVDTINGQTVTIPAMVQGEYSGVIVKRVHSTGTTATDITVYY